MEEVITRATTEGEVCMQEIAEKEHRLVHLEAQVHKLASVGALQEKTDTLQKERDVLLAAATPVL